jgi:hypothetical protein
VNKKLMSQEFMVSNKFRSGSGKTGKQKLFIVQSYTKRKYNSKC